MKDGNVLPEIRPIFVAVPETLDDDDSPAVCFETVNAEESYKHDMFENQQAYEHTLGEDL